MTTNNTWPNAKTYIPLTLEMALAAKPNSGALSSHLPAAAVISAHHGACDDETDSYVEPPLTVPHLIASLDTFGPNISEFPLSIPALHPSVVISSACANELGLQ